MILQALCIISKPLVNSDWSFSPETLNSGKNWRCLCPVWPWNFKDDLEQGTSSMTLQALCIISCNFIAICEVRTGVLVQKSPNLVKSSFELFDLAFWPLTLTFCMDITFVNDNYFWKFHDDTMTQTAKKLWRTSSENLISAAMKQAAPHTCFFFLVFFI